MYLVYVVSRSVFGNHKTNIANCYDEVRDMRPFSKCFLTNSLSFGVNVWERSVPIQYSYFPLRSLPRTSYASKPISRPLSSISVFWSAELSLYCTEPNQCQRGNSSSIEAQECAGLSCSRSSRFITISRSNHCQATAADFAKSRTIQTLLGDRKSRKEVAVAR